MTRDKSKDGFGNRLESYALTHFRPVWRFLQSVAPLERATNKFLVNRAVKKAPNRPHPFSLFQDFTSWDSLTDRTFTGRHLPPAASDYTPSLPPIDQVVKLFARPAGSETRSTTSTQILNHFAQWFTDGFLRTNRDDTRQNTSNHEIDLSPVYGRTRDITRALRRMEGGLLKSQTIGGCEFPPFYFDQDGRQKDEFRDVPIFERNVPEERKKALFAMGVERANVQIGYVMINTLCLREHNRLCRQFARANPGWDDERLFQTARNTLIVMVIKIVIEEYINHLAPYHFEFKAQPRSFYGEGWYRNNWMTVEFNLLYRWHGLATNEVHVGGSDIPLGDTLFNNKLLLDRGLGGCFDDSSRSPCGTIGLFNTHEALLDTERASLALGRAARLQPYNAYRKYCGYPAVTSFAQITGDERRQEALAQLYERPERIEFFSGLFSEDTRPGSPLSPLIGRLVGMDAFSQALTNPLLSERVYNEATFSSEGWQTLLNTRSLSDMVQRNLQDETAHPLVTFAYREQAGTRRP